MSYKRVLIADDHAIIRSGIKFVVKDMFPFAIVHEACNGNEVMAQVQENDYNLIILDINMPGMDAVDLIHHLFDWKEESRILIFSVNPDELYAKRFLNLGALGYLNKQCSPTEVKQAISDVLHGTVYTSQRLKEELRDGEEPERENPFEKLSDKERLVACYYLKGHTSTEIKKMLGVHASTVGTLKTRLFGKLRIKSLVDLVELARLYEPGISECC